MKTQNAPIAPRKSQAVDALKGILENFQDLIFFDYRGFSTKEMNELRAILAEEGAVVKVVKNNIIARALNNADLNPMFIDPTAAVFCSSDSSSKAAKLLLKFFKDNKKTISPKGALADSVIWQASQMEAFSKLPSRMELIATLLQLMQAPVQKFTQLSGDVTARFVRALKAVEDKK